MKHIKKIKAFAGVFTAIAAFAISGFSAFSLVDIGAGESGLINDATTPDVVSIVSDGQTVGLVPVGVGLRGDADESGDIGLYDAVEISAFLIGAAGKDFETSSGFYWADTDLSGKVDLYDAINVAKYLITQGSHEEKWQKILGS